MLSESEIRNIASRCSCALAHASSTERPLMVENAIREALLMLYRKQSQPEPNAGCL